uniref:RING-type E3 ubiquitin transferase n=1 Tax=Ceratitis capitata TaxID=7213 RepID=W8BDB3_CERCA
MNTIHEVPVIGDLNGNEAATLASVVSTSSLTNASSISSTINSTKVTINSTSSDTAVPQTEQTEKEPTENATAASTTTNGEVKKAEDKKVSNGSDSPQASASKTDATTASLAATTATTATLTNGNANKNLCNDLSEDLKIIGHLKNIEKINEKRRLFLNNTISEYTIDEKTETETKTQSINGAETVVSETRIHTRAEEQNVNGKKLDSFSATDVSGQTKTIPASYTPTKYATLPRTPGSPPPKPPMLSRTRSIGIGDQRSYSPTSAPTSPTASGAAANQETLKTTEEPATTSNIGASAGLAPIATLTPTSDLTPTTPLASPSASPSKSSGATPKLSAGKTLITSAVLPAPIKVATVQLREEPTPMLRRVVERPVSLSPEAPKQISVNHYERLIEELKCPGCAYPMKTPILLCKTGHSICQQCTRVLLLCPLCKEPFTNIRSLTVEALCSKAHFRCVNASGGCTVRLQIDLLSWHEKQCIFKPMKCFMGRVWGDCEWSGREAHWKDHLEKEHADKVFTTQTTEMVWNMGGKQKPLTGYYVFMVYDEMFNFYEVHDKERILFTMACTSTVKEKKHNYAFEVTIVHQDNEALAITQKYPVHSEYDKDILAEGTCISMPLTDLAKFIDEDRLLHYRVRIVEIKTPRKSRNSLRSSPHTGIHPTDFQQTQIEGVNLKSVPAEVIVTRKLDDIPYVDNSSAATPRSAGGQSAEGVSETEGERVKVKSIYNGKFSSNESGSESDPEFEAFIAKKWGTPQLHFNRKFLKNHSNESNSADEVGSSGKLDRSYAPDDKISVTSTSTSYKKRVTNSLRKSFRGFKTPQIFNKKPLTDMKDSK